MTSRSMWAGSISFGLVNIPVKVYLATEVRNFLLINYVLMIIEFDTKGGADRE